MVPTRVAADDMIFSGGAVPSRRWFSKRRSLRKRFPRRRSKTSWSHTKGVVPGRKVLLHACQCSPGPHMPMRSMTTHVHAVRGHASQCGPGPRQPMRSATTHVHAVRNQHGAGKIPAGRRVVVPQREEGDPPKDDPVRSCLLRVVSHQVQVHRTHPYLDERLLVEL